jgi:hypothetical protein
VIASPVQAARDLMSTGQAVMGTGLLVPVTGLAGQIERGPVLGAGRPGLASREQGGAQAVTRLKHAGPVAVLAG